MLLLLRRSLLLLLRGASYDARVAVCPHRRGRGESLGRGGTAILLHLETTGLEYGLASGCVSVTRFGRPLGLR